MTLLNQTYTQNSTLQVASNSDTALSSRTQYSVPSNVIILLTSRGGIQAQERTRIIPLHETFTLSSDGCVVTTNADRF